MEGGGGGAQKIMSTHAHHELEPQSILQLGSRAHDLRALEALRVFDALSCYLSLIFKHSHTKWDEKNIVDKILGGHAPVVPRSKYATVSHDKTVSIM